MTSTSRRAPAALVVALFFSQPWIAVAREEVIPVPMRDGATIDTYVRTPSGNNPATDTQTKVASQIIYHDAARPSHLVLPVVATGAN